MNDDLKTAMNEFRAARAALHAFATQPVNPAVVAPLFSGAPLDEWNVARALYPRGVVGKGRAQRRSVQALQRRRGCAGRR